MTNGSRKVSIRPPAPGDAEARAALGISAEGIGRRAIDLVLAHAFGPLGLDRVDLRVLAFNPRAIRCYEACGFVREGIERDAALIGGEWQDDWIMSILEQEYRGRIRSGATG